MRPPSLKTGFTETVAARQEDRLPEGVTADRTAEILLQPERHDLEVVLQQLHGGKLLHSQAKFL